MGERLSSVGLSVYYARDTPRRALVLGGGGVLGFAWMLGALSALESETGLDARDVELAVGTSAGSVTAALLGCGLSVDVIARHHQGIPAPEDPTLVYDYGSATGAAVPPRPGWRPASPRLVLGGLRHPREVPPIVALSGLLPAGRGSLQPVHDLVSGVAATAGHARSWPSTPRLWIVAVDYRTGRRIVFGRDGIAELPGARHLPGGVGADRPSAGRQPVLGAVELADAVRASCSIPGWYPPAMVGGVPYIDGGAVSNASVDVLRDTGIDEAYVFAPMASLEPDDPQTAAARLERRIRRAITKRIVADAAALRATGVHVCLVTPGSADLQAMGANLMNPVRRSEVLESARVTAATQVRRQLAPSRGQRRASRRGPDSAGTAGSA